MSPLGSRHAACVARLNRWFHRYTGSEVIVRVQDPIDLGKRSEPEPDLALVRARTDFYAQAHPTSEDVLLLVEVAESSRQYDREVKLPLYAKSGIPEVWIVDLVLETVECYLQPSPTGFRDRRQAQRGETLTVSTAGGATLTVDEILG
jgi:Uma2 family endonuclease